MIFNNNKIMKIMKQNIVLFGESVSEMKKSIILSYYFKISMEFWMFNLVVNMDFISKKILLKYFHGEIIHLDKQEHKHQMKLYLKQTKQKKVNQKFKIHHKKYQSKIMMKYILLNQLQESVPLMD